MTVRVVERTAFGPYEAAIPEVSDTAQITGRGEFYFDPEDPLVVVRPQRGMFGRRAH